MYISIFNKGISQKVPTANIAIADFLQDVKGAKYQTLIENLRQYDSKSKEFKELKKNLPFVTFSGTFKTLDTKLEIKDKLLSHSGFIVLDFDHVTEPGEADQFTFLEHEKEKLSASPFCYALFVSPSGTGLKMLCKIDGNHLDAFIGLEKHILDKFGLEIDKSGKDITRRCFVSYDPDIYVNEDAEPFKPEPEITAVPVPKTKIPDPSPETPQLTAELEKDLKKVKELTAILVAKSIDITGTYEEWQNVGMALSTLGESGRALFHEVSALNTGYDVTECDKKYDNFLKTSRFKSPAYFFTKCKEVGIYGKKKTGVNLTAPQGKLKSDPGTQEKVKQNIYHSINDYFNIIDIPVEERVVFGDADDLGKETVCIWHGNFWVKVREIDSQGRIEITHKFRYVAFRQFMEDAGFMRLINQLKGKGNTYDFIRVYNNIVKSVNTTEIRELVDKWIRSNNLSDVEEDLTRGSKTYFGDDKLHKLPANKITFKRDTETEAFYYFNNCFVKVTKEKIEEIDYKKLDGYIWLSQINDHEFKYIFDNEGGDFSRFLMLAVNATEKAADYEGKTPEAELHRRKLKAVHTGIGYILHGFKDPAKTKSFDIYDKNISRNSTPEGGSGKSLTFTAISKVIPSVEIDATTYKDDNARFDFSRVDHDTRFIYFNDAHIKFPFKLLFNVITNSVTIKRLYADPITLDPKDSPKVGVTTNYIIAGSGGSFRRRMFDVEYCDFFNDEHPPIAYFKRRFFDNWDKDEWNRFYSFMFDCVQDYMDLDLIKFPEPNFEYRKLISVVSEDFVNFFNDCTELLKGARTEKQLLFEEFRAEYHPDFDKLTKNTFTKWLQQTSAYFGYEINPHHKDNRDRQDGKDFVTLVKKPK